MKTNNDSRVTSQYRIVFRDPNFPLVKQVEVRWVVIDPKDNPALVRSLKQTGASRWQSV